MNDDRSLGVTARELARRTGWPTVMLRRILEEMAGEGLVECDGDRWRLTAAAEHEYGEAFRHLWPVTETDDAAEAA